MKPHPDPVAAAVEAAIATMSEATATALRKQTTLDRAPSSVSRAHARLTEEHPGAYLPRRIFHYCCLIGARCDRDAACDGTDLAAMTARTGRTSQLAQLLQAQSPLEATNIALGVLGTGRDRPRLCTAALWSDLCGLSANQTPRGPAGRTIADDVRYRWSITAAIHE